METNITEIIQLDIVSAEQALFSAEVLAVFATGEMGELGIFPGHTPLLTKLSPGEIRAVMPNQEVEIFYVSGGMLEVQPNQVTVLSDTAIRAGDLDEEAALAARRQAEDAIANREAGFEYSKAATELAQAVAQLRALQKLRRNLK